MLIFGGMVTLPVVLIPLMLQQVQGFLVIDAGLLMLSRGLGSMLSLLLAGTVLTRFDPRVLLAGGFICVAVSNLYMSTWTENIDAWSIVYTNFVQGCASGMQAVSPTYPLSRLVLQPSVATCTPRRSPSRS